MVKKISNKRVKRESKETDFHSWIDSLYYPGFADDMEKLSPDMQDMLKAEYDNYLKSRGIKESRKVRNGNKRKFESARMTPLPKNLFDRAEELDFSDDGAKFRMYKYKGKLPISVSSGYGMVFVCIRPDYVRKRKDYNSRDYYKFCDEFNGVDTAKFNNNMDKFIDNCEKMYDVLFGQNGYAESRKNRKIRESKKVKEALGYPTVTVENIIWNSEWTDIFSAHRDGRSADYELLPRKVTVAKYKIDAMDEDEIISAISEDLYERFYYYPDSFTVYDTETGDFIAEL